ncbi:msl0258 [Mesorhizobium japonicum MAFF 303099]|uniref:Msl0258 protein n=1 Tax=Mesorhizobium japonicum (strain LMG 29417 / CECT 9101 / MAFF 303099) TaxID=266835 RepID=Q98N79_RHILO|nr:msl0258 [Mesorhizobium japonicum MAFF 303099]
MIVKTSSQLEIAPGYAIVEGGQGLVEMEDPLWDFLTTPFPAATSPNR